MEGIFFYWLLWIGWIYVTFLMEKTKLRWLLSLTILISIIISNKDIMLFSISINGAILFTLILSYYIISKKIFSKILYYLCTCMILTACFVTFKLFELFDPVWVMFHPTFKLSFILVILVIMLVKEQLLRLATIIIAVGQGEIIYTLFLNSIVTYLGIGSMQSLDIIALTMSFSLIWYSFENFVKWLNSYVKQKIILGASK